MAHRQARAIQINEAWCKKCGICVAFCGPEVLRVNGTGAPEVVALEACTLCMLCELRCPDFAIHVVEDKEEAAAPNVTPAAHAG
jgi:2-oxoglutarate ferredoxin oxidoreductase subunit delta